MDNNESKILHLARHFETVSLPDGGDKTAYYFESEGRSALSLSMTRDDLLWLVNGDHTVNGAFPAITPGGR